jgi:hypothetical protein
MKNALELKLPAVRLSVPEFDWECRGFLVNEGPSCLIHEGRLYLTYHLKNGGTLKRAYYVEDLNTILPEGRALYGKTDYSVQYYSRLIPVSIAEAELLISGKYLADPETGVDDSQLFLPRQAFGALREAILEDARSGRLPILNSFTEKSEEEDW